MLRYIVRSTGSLLGCLIVTVAFAEGIAEQPLPATPQIGGFTAIGSVYEPTPGPIPEVTGSPIIASGECVAEPVVGCGQPADCQGHCGHNHCGNCRKKCWCSIHTTGDMYPHFPYYPEHHGYYYFRPYNYSNVLMHRSQGLQLGVSPANPYSVSMLDPLFERFSMTNLSRDDDYDRLPPHRNSLPQLESLLDPK